MADIFVSYKSEDRRRVEPPVEGLQVDGYSVWWDKQIGTPDQWDVQRRVVGTVQAFAAFVLRFGRYS